MEDHPTSASSTGEPRRLQSGRLRFAALALVLLVGAVFAWRQWGSPEPAPTDSSAGTISALSLEQDYGLRLRLLAVTAGGGMVDFRLKILDAQKASQLLLDPHKAPQLVVPGKGVTLIAPPDPQQELKLEDGGVFFILFSNSGGAVQPGTPVIVSFGDLQLEPVPAQ